MKIILSAFATVPGSGRDIAQPLSGFSGDVRIINIPMGSGTSNAQAFGNYIQSVRNPVTGRVLPNLFGKLNIPDDVETLGLFGFSAGRAAIQGILQHPDDRAIVDSVGEMDGLHLMKSPSGSVLPQSLDPWVSFGALAIDGSHMMVNAHTVIASPHETVFSTNDSNEILFNALTDVAPVTDARPQKLDRNLLTGGPPPPTVTIFGQAGDVTRKIAGFPPLDITNVGNAWRIKMPTLVLEDGSIITANGPAAHIFVAQYVQGGIFKAFLQPRWNQPETCTMVTSAPTVLNVEIVTMSGCGYCTLVKDYFQQKQVPVTLLPIEDDTIRAQLIQRQVPIQAFPVTIINGQTVVGFGPQEKQKIDQIVTGCKKYNTTKADTSDFAKDRNLDPRNKGPQPDVPVPPPPAPAEGMSTLGTLTLLGALGTAGYLAYKALQPSYRENPTSDEIFRWTISRLRSGDYDRDQDQLFDEAESVFSERGLSNSEIDTIVDEAIDGWYEQQDRE